MIRRVPGCFGTLVTHVGGEIIFMDNARIVSVEWGILQGRRPRHAGKNARLGDHGNLVRTPILRITTEDGGQGFGICTTNTEQASRLLNTRLNDIYLEHLGIADPWFAFDYPLWDLLGQRRGRPVYALAAEQVGAHVQEGPLQVSCYDTSLYFDDLHLSNHEQAAQLMAEEAQDGYKRGHRAFKIKVGRGARHMSPEDGVQRDIAIIQAVRKAVGPHPPLMLDANNGYNLNITKQVLTATADCGIFWMEEAFHEDDVLYQDLQAWLKAQDLAVLISDGEGQADPRLLDWANKGLVDVVQYDYWGYGFTRWLQIGRVLDGWNVRAAPHHYGTHYGNYASGHLAAAIKGFTSVEWDEVETPGLDASGYVISEGTLTIPDKPGFGVILDNDVFQRAVAETGFTLSL